MYLTRVAGLALGGYGLIQAAILEDPLKGYKIVPLTWEVEISPGSGNFTQLNGTVEEVHRQLLEINPRYDEETATLKSTQGAATTLAKRIDFSSSKYFCNGRWKSVDRPELWKGIEYLRKVPGRPTNGPGPGNCGRVSCSYRAGIYWCNDNPNPKTLDSFRDIADGAQWIHQNCGQVQGEFGWAAGQVFHEENWNVIVTSSNC